MLLSSTRRKALYKHIFQKVDKDRDNQITFKVGNSTNSILIYPYPSLKFVSKFNKLLLIWLKGDGQGLKGDTCGFYINRTGQETNRGMSDVIVPPFFPRRFC